MRTLYRLLFALVVAADLWSVAAPAAPRAPSPVWMHDMRFRDIGPAIAGGFVTAVAGVPGDPNVYYVGGATGGVFKTTTGGNTWRAIFAHEATGSIGAIALVPGHLNQVWVGTGEADMRNTVVSGDGIYYSGDGGASWEHLGLASVGQIADIVIDPTNPSTVYVAALGTPWKASINRGVYKTTNAGKTWKKVLYLGKTASAADLVMQPGHPLDLLAAVWDHQRYPWGAKSGGPSDGIYRSTNGGRTWTRLKSGLPQGPVGRIALAVAPSDPSRVYALISSPKGVLWRSDNFGSSWTLVNKDRALNSRPPYYSRVTVSPTNPDEVFFSSFTLLESTNGGRTVHWADLGVHDDHHALWIDPDNAKRMIQGNDGGVYITQDGAKTWRHLANLPLAQFYNVGIANTVPFHVCGGLQDLGVWYGPSTSLGRDAVTGHGWFTVNGNDGAYCVPAPSDPNVIYSDETGGQHIVRYDLQTHVSHVITPYRLGPRDMPTALLKYRFNWVTPIAVSATNDKQVYVGANVVFESKNGGQTWAVISPDLTRNDKSKQGVVLGDLSWAHGSTAADTYDTILALTIAPGHPRVIWVGTDDGLVQVTRDGGKSWRNVTPKGAPALSHVYDIGVSGTDPGTAYAPFDAHRLGNDAPYVYVTHDYGRHWLLITTGLKAAGHVYVVRPDPFNPRIVYLGAENGLYYSLDRGMVWRRFKHFPTVPVRDIKVTRRSHDLVVASYGRGIFVLDDVRWLEQLSGGFPREPFYVFQPGPATEFHHWEYDSRWETDLTAYRARNATPGVYIDYYLHDRPRSQGVATNRDVIATILGPNGQLVRRLKQIPQAGVNRLVWDMRYSDSVKLASAPPRMLGPGPGQGKNADPNRGPLVPPGEYQVRVQYGSSVSTRSVTVRPDPSLSYSTRVYTAYAHNALMARDMVDRLNSILNRLGVLRDNVTAARRDSAPSLASRGSTALQVADSVAEAIARPLYVSQSVAQSHSKSRFTSLREATLRLAQEMARRYPHPLSPQRERTIRVCEAAVNRVIVAYNKRLVPLVRQYDSLAGNAGAIAVPRIAPLPTAGR